MNQKNLHVQNHSPNSLVISFLLVLLVLFLILQTSEQTAEQFLHWFIIPVAMCGIVIGIDAVEWLRGRLSMFDPVGIIGLLGFHFFFLAPLLHVSWNQWLEEWYTYPPDWRPWLGGMALLNLGGLVIYRFSRKLFTDYSNNDSKQIVWEINWQRFPRVIFFALVFSAVQQVLIFQRFGGIAGYINTVTEAIREDAPDPFQGTAVFLIFSECFPILAAIGFAAYARRNKRMQTWFVLAIFLVGFLGLQIIFGGLRGSRANTIWAFFWAVGIINFWVRPISKKILPIGLAFILSFMYVWGFYKADGLDGLMQAFEGQTNRAAIEEDSGRTWQALLLGDLARSDVQAFLFYRLMRPDSDYEYAWGRTYYAAITTLIPRQIWPDRPPDKRKDGTEAQFGKGSYHPELWRSSKVYGLAGEAMLNFGPFVIPFFFIFLGFIVAKVQGFLLRWKPSDTRFFILPFLVNMCFIVLISDLDNDIFLLMKNGAFPFLIIFVSSHRKIVPTCDIFNPFFEDSLTKFKM